MPVTPEYTRRAIAKYETKLKAQGFRRITFWADPETLGALERLASGRSNREAISLAIRSADNGAVESSEPYRRTL